MITILQNLKFSRSLLLGSALLAVTACASTQANPRLADAQTRLAAAYNDKEVAERGQGDLENAKTSLQSAQSDWKKGKKTTAEHNLMMGETYLALAETRGQQAKVEQANAALSSQAKLNAKDQVIANQSSQLSAKDQQLADAKNQLAQYNMQITELGSTMVLQDVSFETGKSVLLPGGVNRLQPLVNYLRLSPDTKVRIEGYTDSVGGAAYNQQLSLDRANSVKSLLTAGGIDGSRIEAVGSGLTKPVATNSTAAGRQANRRVEITLLKQPA